jgi:hypothetical protein
VINDHDRFQKIASGVQAWTLAVATVGAGLWAIFTYTSLNQRQKANFELEDLARRNSLRGILELKLDLSQETDDSGRRFVHAEVTAENKGTKDMIIELDATDPLSAFLLLFDESAGGGPTQAIPKLAGSGFFLGGGQNAQGIEQPLPRQTIRAGETYRFHSIIKLSSPGLYAVVFDAPVHPEDILPGQKGPMHWTVTNYIMVK